MKVFLFSGGFDSFMQATLINPDVLLYIDTKGVYSKVEINHLKNLPKNLKNKIIIKTLPLKEYENKQDLYLPFRNLIFVTIAAEYGNEIFMGFNEADNAPDKDEMFSTLVTALFTHLGKKEYVPKKWDGEFSINMPFKHLTKTEMVKLYSETENKNDLKKVRSCYDSKSIKGCGNCSPCLNKAVALINNGIKVNGLFDNKITKKLLSEFNKVNNIYRPKSRVIKDFENAIKKL